VKTLDYYNPPKKLKDAKLQDMKKLEHRKAQIAPNCFNIFCPTPIGISEVGGKKRNIQIGSFQKAVAVESSMTEIFTKKIPVITLIIFYFS